MKNIYEKQNISSSIVAIGFKTNKVKDNSDCKSYSECKTIAQKKKYCKCIEYERAKGDKNIILAPQPQECIIFCRTNTN